MHSTSFTHFTFWSFRVLTLLAVIFLSSAEAPLSAVEIDPVNPPEKMEVQVAGRTANESWTLQLYRRTCRTTDFKLLLWDKTSGYTEQAV